MMKFSKRDSRKMIKEMARLHGLSVSEVREQIQDKIIAVMNSDDPATSSASVFPAAAAGASAFASLPTKSY